MLESTYPFVARRNTLEEQRELMKRYPLFFRAVAAPSSYRCALADWGIECGPGWHAIIEEAAATIEADLEKVLKAYYAKCLPAWLDERFQDSVTDLWISSCVPDDAQEPLIPFCSEVKERRGSLVIGVGHGYCCDMDTRLRIRSAVRRAARKAKKTCERCGQPGCYRPHSWRRVYCRRCADGW